MDGGLSAEDPLRVVSFNVLMDMFEKWVSGVIRTPERHTAIVAWLATLGAHVIVLNEATPEFVALVVADPYLQANFRLTEVDGEALHPHGVLVLVAHSIPVISVHKVYSMLLLRKRCKIKEKAARPVVVVRIALPSGLVLGVCGVHLASRVKEIAQRRQQLRDLFRLFALGTSPTGGDGPGVLGVHQALIVGDLNMHSEGENTMIAAPYADAWLAVNEEVPLTASCTWDGETNKLIQAMLLGTDKRKMRLDRMLLSAPLAPVDDGSGRAPGQALEVTAMEIIGREERVPDTDLTLSDHYGLLAEFSIAPVAPSDNNDH